MAAITNTPIAEDPKAVMADAPAVIGGVLVGVGVGVDPVVGAAVVGLLVLSAEEGDAAELLGEGFPVPLGVAEPEDGLPVPEGAGAIDGFRVALMTLTAGPVGKDL